MKSYAALILLSLLALVLEASAQAQCGRQQRGRVCPGRLCCSQYGFCGTTSAYCGFGCQSNCRGRPKGNHPDVTTIITPALFDQIVKTGKCQSNGFYTYDAFVSAAQAFDDFAVTGDVATRKRELAAFFAQTSHETNGYCSIAQNDRETYCSSHEFPCAAGKQYYARGPFRLTHNHNYGLAGRAIGADLVSNPDMVSTDPSVAFKTAIWQWMTPQENKPSSHDVITGKWSPSSEDKTANRAPGYGLVTNIISGESECGRGPNEKVASRIGFYKRYCDMLGVSYGDNLDCSMQQPFA